MNKDNPLWGAPRIHGELLKLGFTIAKSTVSKYMVKHRGPPSQTWRTFLRNYAEAIAAIDLCVVPTVTFECLFVTFATSRRTSDDAGGQPCLLYAGEAARRQAGSRNVRCWG